MNKIARTNNKKSKKQRGKERKQKQDDITLASLNNPDGYKVSKFFLRAYDLIKKFNEPGQTNSKVMAAYKQGAENGCIISIKEYSLALAVRNETTNDCIQLALPWALEGAIRGNTDCFRILINIYAAACEKVKCYSPCALCDYWMKFSNKWGYLDSVDSKKCGVMRNELKDNLLFKECAMCDEEDSEQFTLQRCEKCRMYYYCSEKCQTKHWNAQGHRSECKQYQILMKYHKPYAKDIRDAIIRGDDPENIKSLQILRKKLGLTRPREEYEQYQNIQQQQQVSSSSSTSSTYTADTADTAETVETTETETETAEPVNPYSLLIAREDGTVYLGSIPTAI
jgi:hypothetical protein